MRKVLLCLVLCYLMLCGCSEDSGKTADTTTPVLTVDNVAEVVQTFNYTSRKIDFPDIPEDVTPSGTSRMAAHQQL